MKQYRKCRESVALSLLFERLDCFAVNPWCFVLFCFVLYCIAFASIVGRNPALLHGVYSELRRKQIRLKQPVKVDVFYLVPCMRSNPICSNPICSLVCALCGINKIMFVVDEIPDSQLHSSGMRCLIVWRNWSVFRVRAHQCAVVEAARVFLKKNNTHKIWFAFTHSLSKELVILYAVKGSGENMIFFIILPCTIDWFIRFNQICRTVIDPFKTPSFATAQNFEERTNKYFLLWRTQ